MADLTKDLRLAIDTGKVSFGNKIVVKAISDDKAKTIIIAKKGKKGLVEDTVHMCNIAGIRVVVFNGNSLELGAACGKPFSVNSLAILDAGNSNILNEEYN